MSTAPLTHGELAAIRRRFAHLGLSELAVSELVADVVQRVLNHVEWDEEDWLYDGPDDFGYRPEWEWHLVRNRPSQAA